MKNQSKQVKERPIIFSGEMVKAILAGKKTMTRRVVKLQPSDECTEVATNAIFGNVEYRCTSEDRQTQYILAKVKCPHGKIGDRLWVRETWCEVIHTSPITGEPQLSEGDKLIKHASSWIDCDGEKHWNYDGSVIVYKSTSDIEFCDGDGFSGEWAHKDDLPQWKSPIHMPRWASRILLEITDIRVERLQDISEADCEKEGIVSMTQSYPWQDEHSLSSPISYEVRLFTKLWNDINAKKGYPWSSNPWVWVVEFKVIEGA